MFSVQVYMIILLRVGYLKAETMLQTADEQVMTLKKHSAFLAQSGDNHNPDDDIPGATYVFCKSSEGMKLIGSYWPCSHQLASQNDKNFSSFRDYDPIYSQVLIYLL
ncbi:hypothetical protein HID58_026186, partial [Brassica napus]